MPSLKPLLSQPLSVVDIMLLEPPTSTCPGFIHDTTPLLKGTPPVVTELEALFGEMLGAAQQLQKQQQQVAHQAELNPSAAADPEAGIVLLDGDPANDARQVAELMQVRAS